MLGSHEKQEAPAATGGAPAKRIYTKPCVIELGDVRDLTQGASGTQPDLMFLRKFG